MIFPKDCLFFLLLFPSTRHYLHTSLTPLPSSASAFNHVFPTSKGISNSGDWCYRPHRQVRTSKLHDTVKRSRCDCASATSEELVKRGYKVRAATRDVARTKPFADKLDKLYGSDLFEAIHVKDPAAPDAYEGTLKGRLLSGQL